MHRFLSFVVMGFLMVATASAQDAIGTIAKVRESGLITMGVRESSGALSYSIPGKGYAGFHVEICQRIVERLQSIVGKKIEIKYFAVTSQNRIPLLTNGTVDLECGATTNNAARQREVSFAVTTYVEEVRMAVKANSGVTSIEQLGGKRVASTSGTTSIQLLRKIKRTGGADFDEIFAKDHEETFLLLESGRADAFVMDRQILALLIAKSNNPADFKIVGETLSTEPIAIMVRKADPELKLLADDTIKGLIASGEMSAIYEKWFMRPIPPKNVKLNLPISDSTKAAWAKPNDKPLEDFMKN